MHAAEIKPYPRSLIDGFGDFSGIRVSTDGLSFISDGIPQCGSLYVGGYEPAEYRKKSFKNDKLNTMYQKNKRFTTKYFCWISKS